MDFVECDECQIKPGSPVLCSDCLDRRAELGRTGSTRPPRDCGPVARQALLDRDERLKNFRLPEGTVMEIVSSPRPD